MEEQSSNTIAELKQSLMTLDITSHFWAPSYQGFVILERENIHQTMPRISITFAPGNWRKGEKVEFLNGASAILDDIMAKRKKSRPEEGSRRLPLDLV